MHNYEEEKQIRRENTHYPYKRFMLFEVIDYYPSGGLDDCSMSFDSLEETNQFVATNKWLLFGDITIFDRLEGIICA